MSDYADWEPDPLPEGWDLIPDDRRPTFRGEIERELSRGHELFGMTLTPVAACVGCDDTLFFVEDLTRWAVVHLTWSRSAEPPPWPDTMVFDGRLPRAAMAKHAEHVTGS